ncbi:hypothetical protein [Rhizobium terrae]|uniref:hypothetical protein n=1 Tax=Rhizobium terrae TaxID=2171756 RepID=UPI000E3BE1EE|nr:hypothetical protein [Rhizobium terrae]
MADFVAVIRRAVDGLANNTPEMRAKVYDKARGAVQRQLENMKPRPPEDMLRRQMEKLEAAILDVESEHAEALEPLVDDAAAQPTEEAPAESVAEAASEGRNYVSAPEGQPEEPVAAEHAFEPARDEPVPVSHPERPVFREDDYEEPVPAETAAEPVATHEPVAAEPPAATPSLEQEPAAAALAPEEPAPQHYGDWRDDLPPEDDMPAPASHRVPEPAPAPAVFSPVFDEEVDRLPLQEERPVFEPEIPAAAAEPPAIEPAPPEPPSAEVPVDPSHPAEPSFVERQPSAEPRAAEPVEDDFPYPGRGDQHAAAAVPEFAGWDSAAAVEPPPQAVEAPKPVEEDWGWETPAPSAAKEADVAAAWDEVPELFPAGPVEPIDHGAKPAAVDAHFDAETHVAADTVRMPSVSELPDLAAATPAVAGAAPAGALPSSTDPFADYLDPLPEADNSQRKADTKAKPVESDPWGDLEELIGFTKDPSQSGGASRSALHTDADADDLMSAPARPYRVTPVRKRNYVGIILAIIGLALVGGGGYAIWLNRDSLNDMVDGLIQSSLPGRQTAEQTPPPASPAPSRPAPANTTSSQPAPARPVQPPPVAANNNTNTTASPRPADGSIAGSKFTQRLMPDGSELDSGPGGAGGLAQNAEGQSVAQLNAPPANPRPPSTPAAPAPAANTATPAPNSATPPVNAPATSPADAPALAGEKMFLYEERLGQTAPTAIEGAVSWSLQRETAANGRQEPVVQGRINVPGRGLTALLTFKRNSDPSLPASHLIEIVFAVPPDFEGGAIDSVQRIAMKSTEQDRGNALIAVPAKITDDFHMIALNDFPDARTTNLELLRTRNWIDIPIAYRNGRRALLTLQKGPEGERAFNEAIREWGTLGATANGQ